MMLVPLGVVGLVGGFVIAAMSFIFAAWNAQAGDWLITLVWMFFMLAGAMLALCGLVAVGLGLSWPFMLNLL